jgi:tetratricopeptide (TPR) repeat protein
MPIRHSKTFLTLSLGLLILFTHSEASAVQQRRPATQQEETQMLGMIVGAIQDAYGGNVDEARGRFEKIKREIEKRDYSPHLRRQAYNQYGMFLLKTGVKDEAIKALIQSKVEAKALTTKEQVTSTFDLAFAYAHTGDINEAIKEYKAALALDPQNMDVMLELGSAYRRAKLFAEARELYEKLIAANPNNASAYGNLGNVDMDEGNIEAAVANYEKAAVHSSDKEAASKNFLNAGFQYAARGSYEKALALYLRALEISPDNPLAYTDIGWSMLGMGKTQEAIEAFEKALRLDPPQEVKEYARKGLKEARAKK